MAAQSEVAIYVKQELQDIVKLPFVGLRDSLKTWGKSIFICLEISLEKPSLGLFTGVNEKEKVWIFFSECYPSTNPEVFLRSEFPFVPHLTVIEIPKIGRIKKICLSRIPEKDWWCGKTLVDLVLAIHDWLNDAASGNLVKPDDPFEPLIADFSLPVVELNVNRARVECANHKGLWKTTTQKFDLGEADTARFIVGSGKIETLVWYQSEEQSEAWVKRPVNIDDMKSLMVSIGFEQQRFSYWINKGVPENTACRKIIVVGIRRSRPVLGRPDSDEWVAFDIERKSGLSNWKINTHLVHESFTQELSRKLSGYSDTSTVKKVLLIGVGAIGSAISELLVRSGHITVKMMDHDRLQPHNLARHVLTQKEVGLKKAISLSQHFNNLFPSEKPVAEGLLDDLFSFPQDKFLSLLKNVNIIVDCSASVAVLKYLSDIHGLNKPIVSAYQIDQGLGTIMLYTPNGSDTPLNLIELTAISEWRSVTSIRRWLTETINSVEIGGGCRSASAKISYARVMYGASIISNLLLEWITKSELPEQGRADIFHIPTQVSTESHSSVNNIAASMQRAGSWNIVIRKDVSNSLKLLATESPDCETGGILLGQADRQKKIIGIVDCIECVGVKSQTGYHRFPDDLKYKLAKMEKQTAGMLHYVGEWHSHPASYACVPSSTDKSTMKELAALMVGDRLPALCAISNGNDSKLHVVEHIDEDAQ